MSTITIPVDVHLITLYLSEERIVTREVQVGRTTRTQRERQTSQRDIPPEVSAQDVRTGFQEANRIWQVADIRFIERSCVSRRASAPGGQAEVNQDGFLSLAVEFPANNGVSALVVRSFSRHDLGGSAYEPRKVCILQKLGSMFGYVLAHEFGHLLGLPHVSVEDDSAIDNFNLMYPGLRAGNTLTEAQITQARNSSLVRQVGSTSP